MRVFADRVSGKICPIVPSPRDFCVCVPGHNFSKICHVVPQPAFFLRISVPFRRNFACAHSVSIKPSAHSRLRSLKEESPFCEQFGHSRHPIDLSRPSVCSEQCQVCIDLISQFLWAESSRLSKVPFVHSFRSCSTQLPSSHSFGLINHSKRETLEQTFNKTLFSISSRCCCRPVTSCFH